MPVHPAADPQISPANVHTLAPKWTLTANGNVAATPTVSDGAVYVPDQGGTLWVAGEWSRSSSSTAHL